MRKKKKKERKKKMSLLHDIPLFLESCRLIVFLLSAISCLWTFFVSEISILVQKHMQIVLFFSQCAFEYKSDDMLKELI